MNFRELFLGNYKNEDDYVPSLIRRYKNKFLTYKESKKFCSCGLRRYCLFHYIFPIESEKMKFVKEINDEVKDGKK